MRHPIAVLNSILLILVSVVFFEPAHADYSSVVSGDATMTGDAGADTLTFTDGGTLLHNRFTEGDGGFNSNSDFDTAALGD